MSSSASVGENNRFNRINVSILLNLGIGLIKVGLNGLGRFGLRLLRLWIHEKNSGKTNYEIVQINEPFSSPSQIVRNLKADAVVGPIGFPVRLIGKNTLSISNKKIGLLSESKPGLIPWSEDVSLVFECSGQFTKRKQAMQHFRKNIRKVLISATSMSADKTLIVGFNEKEYAASKHHVVSYGSCTINCFLPVAKIVHSKFGILSASASVIHNTTLNKISKPFGEILLKPCTLEYVGPKLFPVLKDFFVNYRTVPYPGVSLMDLRFVLKKKATPRQVNRIFEEASRKSLKGLVQLLKSEKDSNAFIGSSFSAIVLGKQTRVIGNQLLLSAWFDNENSATRFNDVAKIIVPRL